MEGLSKCLGMALHKEIIIRSNNLCRYRSSQVTTCSHHILKGHWAHHLKWCSRLSPSIFNLNKIQCSSSLREFRAHCQISQKIFNIQQINKCLMLSNNNLLRLEHLKIQLRQMWFRHHQLLHQQYNQFKYNQHNNIRPCLLKIKLYLQHQHIYLIISPEEW